MNLILAKIRIQTIVQKGLELGWRASDFALLFEYARRLQLLEREIRILARDETINVSFLFDASECATDDPEKLRQDCKEVLAILPTGLAPEGYGHARRVMENYICWVALVQQADPVAVAHADLFEPLIRMLERGASFNFHKGWADFATGGTPIEPGWRKRKLIPLGNLDDASLDEYDRSIQAEEEGRKKEQSHQS